MTKKRFFLKALFALLLILPFSQFSQAQIYAPEGLNMPGSWDAWANPPTNASILGNAQSGGNLTLINLATDHYQTIFKAGTNLPSGASTFVFSSGPSSNYWANKWTNTDVVMNTVLTSTLNGATDNTVTLVDTKWYVMNWEDAGYANTRCVFMETASEPAGITNVSYLPVLPAATDAVEVSITLNRTKSAQEYFYVRYTTNNWTSSTLVEASFTGTNGTATIPAQSEGTTVKFYVFSTTFANPIDDFDIKTIYFDNNSENNYIYSIGTPTINCDLANLLVSSDPTFPNQAGGVTITFNAALGNQGLMGQTADVYAHLGVITNLSTNDSDWKYVKTAWGVNTPATLFTKIGPDLYELAIADIRTYFGVPGAEDILKIAMVMRSEEPILPANPNNFYVAKTIDNTDIYVDIYTNELNVKFLNPVVDGMLVNPNDIVPVCVEGLLSTSIELFIDGNSLDVTAGTSSYALPAASYTSGIHTLRAEVTDGSTTAFAETDIYIRGAVNVAALPAGIDKPGIHYIDNNTVTLVLHDPPGEKEFVFVIGDFNDWKPNAAGYMNATPDGQYFWVTLSGLTPGTEYAFQYYIDEEIRIAEPYADKVLDPWNDQWITAYNYPNLKAYPTGKTQGIVSVLETGQTEYNWQHSDNFVPSAQGNAHKNLIIYELHVRDFVATQSIKDVKAKLDYLEHLGVNCIELMPMNEFEGNDSWGYNPSFYFAPDKAYGTKNDLKDFIDEAHNRGISVVLDMVLNHSYQQSPFVLMYFDPDAGQYGRTTPNNPWYNEFAPNSTWSWGYDFNHQSTHTRTLVKRITEYWIKEYKMDGFRFDFTKGFTNTGGDGWAYDQSRIDILQDYYDHIQWSYNNGSGRYAYVILEHLTNNAEEQELASRGMMLWSGAGINENYRQAAMGFQSNSDFSSAYYGNRGFSNANLVQYMESHDEERVMYSAMNFGDYTHTLENGIKYSKAAAAFFMMIPGPKMLWQFQELGYDISIDDPCRVCPKPLHWEYYDEPVRKDLFNSYSYLARLIEETGIFTGGNQSFSSDLAQQGKKMWISNGTTNMVLAANFSGGLTFDMAPGFQHGGTWYDFFTGETLEVSDPGGHTVNFSPGEMHLWVDANYIYLDTDKLDAAKKVSVYPNPADSYFTVSITSDYELTVLDISGKIVKQISVSEAKNKVDISDLKQGIYLLKFSNEEGLFYDKIVVE